MPGCTITHMEYGHPGGQDMEDTVLVFMDVRSVKLPLNQKASLKPTLGCTIMVKLLNRNILIEIVFKE